MADDDPCEMLALDAAHTVMWYDECGEARAVKVCDGLAHLQQRQGVGIDTPGMADGHTAFCEAAADDVSTWPDGSRPMRCLGKMHLVALQQSGLDLLQLQSHPVDLHLLL